MNKVILIGRLVSDPDCKIMNGTGKPVTRFTLAVEKGYKTKSQENNADFIPCVCFGRLAEIFGQYVTKGAKIIVEGSWTTGKYQNREGVNIYTHDCAVSKFEFLSKVKRDEAPEDVERPTVPANGFLDIDPDENSELPFL